MILWGKLLWVISGVNVKETVIIVGDPNGYVSFQAQSYEGVHVE